MPDDLDVLSRIRALVEEEHSLTSQEDGAHRRKQLEEELDQCWDLLRQRRARREFGEDPGNAHARSVDQVEKYLQ
ncbi:MAG TPA: DUF2630 family protein [Sporichthyaceae bacterium]|jgi:hypothetical protein|nr:DUF2630 family protein [Sporichthyaceae bacterium]